MSLVPDLLYPPNIRSVMASDFDDFWDSTNKKEADNRNNAWMMTFADLLSLMLTFFILIYSMSQLQKTEWNKVVRSFHEQFKMKERSSSTYISNDASIQRIDVPEALNLDYLYAILEQKLLQSSVSDNFHLSHLGDRILISLPNNNLFVEGSSVVNEEARVLITSLGQAMRSVGNRVDIIAHTDPAPLVEAEYPSNWELSLARAIVVAEAIRAAGNSFNINAFGNADAQFSYLPESATDEEKYGLARRVDIVIRGSQADYLPDEMITDQDDNTLVTEGVR